MLSFLLLCPVFSINASAADEENLISHNFNDWSKLPQYEQYTTLYGNSKVNGIQVLMCGVASEINDKKIAVGGLYDISDEYVVGDNYELSFEFLSSDKYIGTALGTIGSDRAFHDYSSILIVGVGSFNNNEVTVDEEYSIIINSDNYNDYINGTLKLSFEMPSGLINPCVAVSFICVNADADQVNNVYLTFRNFQLINKSAQKEDNFFSRLFEWFEVKFKAIGDSFTDLKDSFVGKINDLKESFQKKIDELKQSFIDLKNDLIEGIKGLFVPDEEFINQWNSDMELTLSEHLGFIYQIPALTVDYVQRLQALFSDKSIYFSIPAFHFEFNGDFINLWPETSVDFSFLTNAKEGDIWHTIYKQMYPVFLRLVLFGILIKYGRNEWDKVMMN